MTRAHRITVGTLCTLLLLLLPGWVLRHDDNARLEAQRERLATVAAENESLRAELHLLRLQAARPDFAEEFVEHSVRDQLGFVGPEERVFLIERPER